MWIATGISFALHGTVAVLYPTLEIRSLQIRPDQIIIEVENLPETRQIQRPPPPPRPAVPIETESADVPDDVTIETTDLDFDDIPVDLPPPPTNSTSDLVEEEEIVEFWAVSQAPELIQDAAPDYPPVAKKAGLEGIVWVRFLVGRDGRVRDATVMRGQEIFREAALAAALRFVFRPAMQNDRAVAVWMTRRIQFKLTE
jgi:protein TonB